MIVIITCVRGVRKIFDKNGAIWCILSVPKISDYQSKNRHFFINQQPKLCAKFFLQDQSRRTLWHKNNYIHIKGGSGGGGH